MDDLLFFMDLVSLVLLGVLSYYGIRSGVILTCNGLNNGGGAQSSPLGLC